MIKQGDYFLLPYKGTRRDRLVYVDTQYNETQWYCHNLKRQRSLVELTSCTRISPAYAARIKMTHL